LFVPGKPNLFYFGLFKTGVCFCQEDLIAPWLDFRARRGAATPHSARFGSRGEKKKHKKENKIRRGPFFRPGAQKRQAQSRKAQTKRHNKRKRPRTASLWEELTK